MATERIQWDGQTKYDFGELVTKVPGSLSDSITGPEDKETTTVNQFFAKAMGRHWRRCSEQRVYGEK